MLVPIIAMRCFFSTSHVSKLAAEISKAYHTLEAPLTLYKNTHQSILASRGQPGINLTPRDYARLPRLYSNYAPQQVYRQAYAP